MTKWYREVLDHVTVGPGGGTGVEPEAFVWRGQSYRVLQVIGHWREDPGWWRRPDGQPIRIQQTDLWRVEAMNGTSASRGVYELIHRPGVERGSEPGVERGSERRAGEWALDRVWD